MRLPILSFLALAAAATTQVTAQNITIEVLYSAPCNSTTKNGDVLSVNYNGTLTDGSLFDSSYDETGSSPFSFTIGTGQVIQGWEIGLLNMCVGDRRKLTLPPAYAYGERGVGTIPPNSTLIFYTELEGITTGSAKARRSE